jgi:hypothetical protein
MSFVTHVCEDHKIPELRQFCNAVLREAQQKVAPKSSAIATPQTYLFARGPRESGSTQGRASEV